MDANTGKIYDVLDRKHLKEIESKLGNRLVPLTEVQALNLRTLSKRRRKALLAGMDCLCASGKSFKKCCYKKYSAKHSTK